jgi:hypothetical protein
MDIQLNVIPTTSDGSPIEDPVITLFMYAANGQPAPMEPRIRNQSNFYVATIPYAPHGFPPPYGVYGTVTGKGLNTTYFGPVNWDGLHTLDIPVVCSFKSPFKAAPRFWKGNMCGVRIAGMPPISGGNPTIPELVLSWFYDRYLREDRVKIENDWKSKDLTHTLTSWPDSRAYGYDADGFINTQRELIDKNFYPCPFLCSKDFDPHSADAIIAEWQNSQILEKIVAANIASACIGWELSIWLSPTDVQKLIDYASAILLYQEEFRLYVHFQEGYMGFQQPGGSLADFWKPNVGKLTGVLYQKRLVQNDVEFLDSIYDCLIRMAGGFNMPDDSGFGHPFDFVALELDSVYQFDGTDSEADGNRLGQLAINAPHVTGPTGVTVQVMGAGNGL